MMINPLVRLAVSLFAIVSCYHLHAAEQPPNIILILSDDQSYTDYSFMGHAEIETPHLDKLASESALFRRGYVPTALCRPALATIITGLYAHQTGITGNDPAPTQANKEHAETRGKDVRELLISHIDQNGSAPEMVGRERIRQFSKWQMVGRIIRARRFYRRNDPGFSQERRTAR